MRSKTVTAVLLALVLAVAMVLPTIAMADGNETMVMEGRNETALALLAGEIASPEVSNTVPEMDDWELEPELERFNEELFNDTILFSGIPYKIWEADYTADNTKITVGLIPAEGVDEFGVVIWQMRGDVTMSAYYDNWCYIWYPTQEVPSGRYRVVATEDSTDNDGATYGTVKWTSKEFSLINFGENT